MATKEQIITAILEVAGNPAAGQIRDLAEAFADAVVAIDTPAKEVRVVEVKETRQLFPFLATAPLGLFPSPSGVFFYALFLVTRLKLVVECQHRYLC